jgi:RecJ-like exonuclease
MSIFGISRLERLSVVLGDIRLCDDCAYDGPDCNRQLDVCNDCGGNSPADGPDKCSHCGVRGRMMIACPECDGRLSLNYEVLEPRCDARRAFRRFDDAATAIAKATGKDSAA